MKTVIDPALKGKELYDFLTANKSLLIAEKKYEPKLADAISFSGELRRAIGGAIKANVGIIKAATPGVLDVTSVINTTNWYDSHGDVHIPGLWKKSLSEQPNTYLLQEHNLSFKGIITDEVKSYTQKMLWRDLDVDVDGYTEALIFESVINDKRNPFMFDQYQQGYVKNHSVGMRYVKIELAINDEDYKAEFAVWNKYIDSIANRNDAEAAGYFWPVTEAKRVEGSAVPIGSNIITPTLSVTPGTEKQPSEDTEEQPPLPQPKGIFKSISQKLNNDEKN